MYVDTTLTVSTPIFIEPTNSIGSRSLFPSNDIETTLYEDPVSVIPVDVEVDFRTMDASRLYNSVYNGITEAASFNSQVSEAVDYVNELLTQLHDYSSLASETSTTSGDRETLNFEVQAIIKELNLLSTTTEVGGIQIFNGGSQEIATGPSGQTTTITFADISSESLGLDSLDLTTQSGAESAITSAESAIDAIELQKSATDALTDTLNATSNALTGRFNSEELQSTDAAQERYNEESFESVKRAVYDDIRFASIAQGQNIENTTIMTLLG